MLLSEYYKEVLRQATKYGYSEKTVRMFSLDIDDCYVEGLSVEQCLAKVF